MRGSTCFCGIFAGIIVIALVIGLVVVLDATATKTSATVETVAHNTAHIEAGERMIVTHMVGKVRQEWWITYDGVDHVTLDCKGWCGKIDATLGTVGEKIKVDLGWASPNFYVTRTANGGVDVRWPDGWFIYR